MADAQWDEGGSPVEKTLGPCQSQENSLSELQLSFLICQMGTIRVPTSWGYFEN